MKLLPPELLAHASPQELELYEHQLQYELAKRSPLDLMCWLSPETVRAPHLEYLNEIIVAFVEYRLYKSGAGPTPIWVYTTDGEDRHIVPSHDDVPFDKALDFWGENPDTGERTLLRLAIAMPPRHGKSFLVSEHLPLWYWMRHPDNHIAFVTYSDDFATKTWGKKMRDKLLENEEKLGITLAKGERHGTDHLYFNETGGEMFLVGTGGALTGKGFQLGIIDDPIKDAVDALSQANRNAAGNFYSSVFIKRKTRLPERGLPLEIMMFTRWHEDDLAGRFVYEEDGSIRDDWYMIRIPALAEADDPLGREEGEALWSMVRTRAQLLAEQKEDPMWFAAQFQGTPTFGESGMFPKFHFYKKTKSEDVDLYHCDPPNDHEVMRIIRADDCVRFATLDMAATNNSWSDYSVYSVWDFHRAQQLLILVDFVRERVTVDQHEEWLRNCYRRWADTTFVGIEDKTYGKGLLQQMIRKGGITVRPLKADRDKVARALPYGQAAANGQIYFPQAHPKIHEWTSEHAPFPNGTHDDMVDTGGYAWAIASTMPHLTRKENLGPKNMEEKLERYMAKREKDVKRMSRKGNLYGRLGR